MAAASSCHTARARRRWAARLPAPCAAPSVSEHGLIMTNFPRSPRLTKGAIVGIDIMNPLASVIVFQYNPESVTRTLQPQSSGEGGDRAEALRLKGAPVETIKL